MPTVQEILLQGAENHRRGNLPEAERLYRMVLQAQPTQADALHLLGVISGQTNRPQEALDLIRRAIAINGQAADFHNNLGVVLLSMNRLDEAAGAFQQGLQLNPQSPEAHNGLGGVLRGVGRLAEAARYFEHAITLRAVFPEAINNLAGTFVDLGNPQAAIPHSQKALSFNPQFAEAYFTLARAYRALGQEDLAIKNYETVLQLKPDTTDAYVNLGNIYLGRRQLQQAAYFFQLGLQYNPRSAEAHNNLGTVHREQGQSNDAIREFRTAIELNPNYSTAFNNLGAALNDQGQIDEALPLYRRAVELNPQDRTAHSNLLMSLLYSPKSNLQEILDETKGWVVRHAAGIQQLPSESWDWNPDRRLRIGYLGANFQMHPVGYFFDPVIRHHDKKEVETFVYANMGAGDDWTERMKRHAHHWYDVPTLSDDELARKIRADKIDILVDLSGHHGASRLLAFLRRPAPIQVTTLGYMATTGLPTMDYFITDKYVVPAAEQKFYTEKVVYLPDSFYCMDPLEYSIDVKPLPALKNKYVTFGCFNNMSKINPGVLDAWFQILNKVADSRLFLKTRSLADASVRESLAAKFVAQGIAADRLIFEGHAPRQELLAAYNRVDLALDPFPYTGGVTTFESLWMGVPCVTLSQSGFVGHNGESTLTSCGLQAWVAKNVEEYVHKNTAFAEHLDRLGKIRAALRDKVKKSPLCDGAKFTKGLEAVYRQLWKRQAAVKTFGTK